MALSLPISGASRPLATPPAPLLVPTPTPLTPPTPPWMTPTPMPAPTYPDPAAGPAQPPRRPPSLAPGRLPTSPERGAGRVLLTAADGYIADDRSEEHTSELQS